ncbi:hypothetical protein ASPFODRAFT_52876 [Aspergillus luchuensis CBS 106.47]|uniref:Uncharacterized protein n=1 Tax=Aspergillus luchuensis (strain CBS 106.47) TaxID=1137211 RepID=A0A1M3T1M8_ASPLC|nr:hypothetical protein ASPFODRAFT_52876 [Aspergillus luchuensis CBS 106.47]
MSFSSKSSKSSRSSSLSSNASQGSEKTHTLSVNIYGRGNPAMNDPPAHWGAMIHKTGEQSGDLYHVRKNEDFYYHPQQRPVESTTTYGRSDITRLSNSGRVRAAQVLDSYGNNNSNLPRGNQNCQDWTVGALGSLERQNLAPKGTEGYWKGNIGKASEDIGAQLTKDGMSWVPKSNVQPPRQAPADATFGQSQKVRPVGRLNLDKFANLSGGAKKRT